MMRPVSLDTNLLVRAPLEDDPRQAATSRELLRLAGQGPGIVLSAFAVLELAWVLKVRKIPREVIASAIRSLMGAEGVQVTHGEILLEALGRYEAGSADLAECLIHADGLSAGAGAFATFDRIPRKEGWGILPDELLERLREPLDPA